MTLRELIDLLTKIIEENGQKVLDYDVQIDGCFYGCYIDDNIGFEIDHDTKDITIK